MKCRIWKSRIIGQLHKKDTQAENNLVVERDLYKCGDHLNCIQEVVDMLHKC